MSNLSKGNSKSQLLNEEENLFLFNVLGKGCFTLATGVAQLFVVRCHGNRHQWVKQCCGVVCFVKDNPKKSYFLRLYDIQSQQLLWEQELYTKFIYNSPKEFFHTFEAHDYHAGLNFASEDEAVHFANVVEGKLLGKTSKRKAREDRKAEMIPVTSKPEANKPAHGTVTDSANTVSVNVLPDIPETEKTTKPDSKVIMRNKKGKKSKKLSKDDVGGPVNFVHVSHMSWSVDDGPHMDKLDNDMKELLKKIGVVDRSQVDNDTMDFICDFVDRHGGANAVKEDFAWHVPAEPSLHNDMQNTAKHHPVAHPHTRGKPSILNRPLPALPTETKENPKSPKGKYMVERPIVKPDELANKSSLLHKNSIKSTESSKSSRSPPNIKHELAGRKPPLPGPSPNAIHQTTISTHPTVSTVPNSVISKNGPNSISASTTPSVINSLQTHSSIEPHSSKSDIRTVSPKNTTIATSHTTVEKGQINPSVTTHKSPLPPPKSMIPDHTSHFPPSPPSNILHSPTHSPHHPSKMIPGSPSHSYPPSIIPNPPTHINSRPLPIKPDPPPRSNTGPPPIKPDPHMHSLPPPPPIIPDPTTHSLPPPPPIIPDITTHSLPLPPPPPAIPDPPPPPSNIPVPPEHSMPPPPPYLQDAPTHTHFGTSTEKILPPENSTRAGLLDEIQTFKGHDLKHVEIDEHVSDRGGLLSQIRKGTILRHVDIEENPTSAKRGSIAAALMNQLMMRKTIVQFSDDDYSSDEFDDDWDDD
ncbi:actin nucleation-promoting factor WASL-like isoform X2 [Ruditapes philippinarum]|uniref:actin nucleation-promoting factor WASL-like isoform X2 n=1 Tax=Ruditapes philippinarum TaxID=129788 RepID=UPI00295B3911|nr:actin nucleation-promoting factor WASL-like isoform X2 [Ruditapes philippinarum]